jgi:ADP-ribose pyrophosphatase
MSKDNEKRVGVGFGVMILKDEKVLLGLRNEDPEKADTVFHEEGTWTMPGGKLDYGETFEQGGVREVKEETDIDIKKIAVVTVQNDMNEHAHFVTIGLFAKEWSGEPKTMEPDEIVKWEWFDLDNLPQKLYFPSAKCIAKYKSGKFYEEDK